MFSPMVVRRTKAYTLQLSFSFHSGQKWIYGLRLSLSPMGAYVARRVTSCGKENSICLSIVNCALHIRWGWLCRRTGRGAGGAFCVSLGVGVANAVVPEAELSVTKYVDGFCGAIRLLSSMVTVIVGNNCSYEIHFLCF